VKAAKNAALARRLMRVEQKFADAMNSSHKNSTEIRSLLQLFSEENVRAKASNHHIDGTIWAPNYDAFTALVGKL